MKIREELRKNASQLIFVFISFALMVVTSYALVREIMESHLETNAYKSLEVLESVIDLHLREPEVSLLNASLTVQDMIAEGRSTEELVGYLERLTEWFEVHPNLVSGFNGLYGVARGDYLDGAQWTPPADYVIEERPWYIKPTEEDDTQLSAPYVDAHTGKTILSVSRKITDKQNQYDGTLAIDVDISKLAYDVVNTALAEGGYGILLDKNLGIIAHRDESITEKSMLDINDSYKEMGEMLLAGQKVTARQILDVDGTKMVMFFRQIPSGWYIGLGAPEEQYYRGVHDSALFLSALGVIFVVLLSAFLIRMSYEKAISEKRTFSTTELMTRTGNEIRAKAEAIVAACDKIVSDKGVPIWVRSSIGQIRQTSNELSMKTSGIIDLSSVRNGMLEIEAKSFALSGLIDKIIYAHSEKIEKRGLAFSVRVDKTLPKTLIGDEKRLNQICFSLLDNAYKYTAEGGIRFSMQAAEIGNGRAEIVITVQDSGIGIKEGALAAIFDEQREPAQGDALGGIGMDLPIVKLLCELMEGEVSVSSIYGQGSEFTVRVVQAYDNAEPIANVKNEDAVNVIFYEQSDTYANDLERVLHELDVSANRVFNLNQLLKELGTAKYTHAFVPAEEIDPAIDMSRRYLLKTVPVQISSSGDSDKDAPILRRPAYCASVADILNGNLGGVTGTFASFKAPNVNVMVVDDIESNLLAMKTMLGPYEVQVTACTSGEKALALLQRSHYDVLMVDHMMPGMDGIDILKAVRALGGEHFQKMPVVAMTSNEVVGIRESLIKQGMTDYLQKPVKGSELDKVMRKALGQGELEPAAKGVENGDRREADGERQPDIVNRRVGERRNRS